MAIFLNSGFENADMSDTSADGFQWGLNNLTSVVTMNAPCDNPDTPVVVWNNQVLCNSQGHADPPKDWTPKNGNYCLRATYQIGKEQTEQRFDAIGSYPELWVSYWLRVPTNFFTENSLVDSRIISFLTSLWGR